MQHKVPICLPNFCCFFAGQWVDISALSGKARRQAKRTQGRQRPCWLYFSEMAEFVGKSIDDCGGSFRPAPAAGGRLSMYASHIHALATLTESHCCLTS